MNELKNNIVVINKLYFSRNDRVIFDDVDMSIERGKITVIMGPSGTGKTTLLKIIGGQLAPKTGSVEFDGENIHKLSREKLYIARKKMGMLFQSGALFTHLNVFDNVAFPLREHTNLNELMIRDIVLMKLEIVGLRGARNLMPSELSGGMERRVALSRAIALDPKMIMYDEPFTGQDPISKGVLVRSIKSLNDVLGMTSVIVSHDVVESAAIADYIYIISKGKIIGQGRPKEVINSSSELVKQFMHGLSDGPVPFHYPCRDYLEDLLSDDL